MSKIFNYFQRPTSEELEKEQNASNSPSPDAVEDLNAGGNAGEQPSIPAPDATRERTESDAESDADALGGINRIPTSQFLDYSAPILPGNPSHSGRNAPTVVHPAPEVKSSQQPLFVVASPARTPATVEMADVSTSVADSGASAPANTTAPAIGVKRTESGSVSMYTTPGPLNPRSRLDSMDPVESRVDPKHMTTHQVFGESKDFKGEQVDIGGLSAEELEYLKRRVGPQVIAAMRNSGTEYIPGNTVASERGYNTIRVTRKEGFLRPRGSSVDDEQPSDEKHEGGDVETGDGDAAAGDEGETPTEAKPSSTKFGTWDGVFASCLLNIFGVIMFLRLGWVVGQAGVLLTELIILLSCIVVTLTALSMSAIATNGTVKAGGAYYLISRAVGPNIGGAIGVLFSLGNCVAVSLYVIGFCETLVQNLPGSLTGDDLNDVRVYGLILTTVLLIMALIGVGWVIKLQLGLLLVLIFAILSFLFGPLAIKDEDKGILGFSGAALSENIYPGFTNDGFMETFSVFFPAVTGIMAGTNISGDLKDPSKNIPMGTLSAVFSSTIVYMIMALFCGWVVAREAGPDNGLLNDTLIMAKVSLWGPLILIGVYAATFSSALASLVGAPRLLQSVAKDDLIPILAPFKKARANGDPVRAYFFAFFVACGCVLIGELNTIAPLISMFFMMTYALINYSCFELSQSKAPGWRPAFRYYNRWTALFGAVICLVMMFLIDHWYALAALVIGVALFFYIRWRKPDVNWGSALEAKKQVNVIEDLLDLRMQRYNVKNFRPNFLILSSNADWSRNTLLSFGNTLRHGYGITVYGHVEVSQPEKEKVLTRFADEFRVPGSNYVYANMRYKVYDPKVVGAKLEPAPIGTAFNEDVTPDMEANEDSLVAHDDRNPYDLNGEAAEQNRDVIEMDRSAVPVQPTRVIENRKAAFLDHVVATSFRSGARNLMMLSGMGSLRPNTLVMGYLNRWRSHPRQYVEEYVDVLRDAFRLKMGVMVVRGVDEVDWSKPPTVGTLDVYWLVDDGGLTVLMAHLLLKDAFWRQSLYGHVKVRLFVVSQEEFRQRDQEEVSELLNRYRFVGWEVHAITLPADVQPRTMLVYDECVVRPDGKKYDTQQHRARTMKYLRLAEAMKKYSRKARLVICTIPFPRNRIDAFTYYSWLELLSESLYVPVVLMRGNNQEVLTAGLE